MTKKQNEILTLEEWKKQNEIDNREFADFLRTCVNDFDRYHNDTKKNTGYLLLLLSTVSFELRDSICREIMSGNKISWIRALFEVMTQKKELDAFCERYAEYFGDSARVEITLYREAEVG